MSRAAHLAKQEMAAFMPIGKTFVAVRQQGFTYVFVMALVAVLGAGLAALAPQWAEQGQREREKELLRIGELYARAIESYHTLSPGSLKRYPPSLESLVLDTRFVGTKRHMRKLYKDPMNPSKNLAIVKAPDGGVLGVYSEDPRPPFLQSPLDLGTTKLLPARRYSDWKFIAKVQT
jgi:type II secretory pathway pseudopilin PulG